MTPVSMPSPMASYAANARYAMPMSTTTAPGTPMSGTPAQLPAKPEQLPAASAPADGVHLSDRARALSARAVVENPVAASALSSNENVDALATSVYASKLSMQAIETYSETYRMATEQYQSVEETSV